MNLKGHYYDHERGEYLPVEPVLRGLALDAYKTRVFELGCAICRLRGWGATPPHLHHPRTGVGAARRAPDSDVIPLCPEHHTGSTGVHGMGRKAFERHYGVTELELVAQTQREAGWDCSVAR
jgi:hypothetical protein